VDILEGVIYVICESLKKEKYLLLESVIYILGLIGGII
jgi:hypothetical protein